jgi:hypothetical protein
MIYHSLYPDDCYKRKKEKMMRNKTMIAINSTNLIFIPIIIIIITIIVIVTIIITITITIIVTITIMVTITITIIVIGTIIKILKAFIIVLTPKEKQDEEL